MQKIVWFDMDGTIYPLYKIPGWLDRLDHNDMSVFNERYARKSLPKIRKAVRELMANGWIVGILTWAPMGVTESERTFSECESMKLMWLRKNFPEISEDNFFCLEYGKSKRQQANMLAPEADVQVLVDDNKAVRTDWRKLEGFVTINASRGYVKELEGLIG